MEKLLDGVDVEWKPLGDVAEYEQPTKYLVNTKNYSDEFKTPVLTAGKTFILGYTDETKGIYKASETPVIIFDDFTTANKWVDFDFKAKSSAMKMITSRDESEILLKYIYYWLNTLPSDLMDSDHKRQWISNFANKLIPIPPLHVQSEIVRILDNFTELTTELTAELTARKKQYSYYRDKLLTFKDGEVEFKTLGEIADVGVGSKPEIICETIQNFEYINAGTTNSGYTDNFNCDGDTVTTPSRGQGGIGFVGYQKNEFWLGPLCYKIRRKEDSDVITKYLYYFLEHNNYLILGLKKEGGVPAVNRGDLIKLNIPIPSLEEQQKIVATLDNFDTLINSISEGLPKEIELRTKQYEYYRDLLLTFPKKEIEA